MLKGMGMCISGCVNLATYCHDKLNDWRYQQDTITTMEIAIMTAPSNQQPGRPRSIHTAVIDKNVMEVGVSGANYCILQYCQHLATLCIKDHTCY